jgi:hypothetical protein
MPTMMDLLAWCRTERASLQRQLELMEAGGATVNRPGRAHEERL